MASTITTISARPVEVRVGCHACGTSMVIPNGLAGRWLAAHRMPAVLAVLVLVGGRPEWWQVRG
jgi:hypothetical protein